MNHYITRLPRLASGAHDAKSGELCIMEMKAFIECQPHSDNPPCVDPIFGEYLRPLNDRMIDSMGREYASELLLPYLWLLPEPSSEYRTARITALVMHTINNVAPIALDGLIPAWLVEAMRRAGTLAEGEDAARAAAYAVYAADAAAYAANIAQAAGAAHDAARAAAGAAHAAARAAAYAVYAADDKRDAIWREATKGIDVMLAIGPRSLRTPNTERLEALCKE